jgi:hypothetical protein
MEGLVEGLFVVDGVIEGLGEGLGIYAQHARY